MASGRIPIRNFARRIAIGAFHERLARSLDAPSEWAKVCMSGFLHPAHAGFSGHTGCFPYAKFELIINQSAV